MHRLSENIRLCPIVKTLKMLLFTSFCPTHACTTPAAGHRVDKDDDDDSSGSGSEFPDKDDNDQEDNDGGGGYHSDGGGKRKRRY
jgi:hypothetical protein